MAGKVKIVWSPDINNVNGQNVVTETVYKNLDGTVLITYPSGSSIRSIFLWLFSVAKFYRVCFSSDVHLLYIVNSRTVHGFFRDTPILFLSIFYKSFLHCHGSDILHLKDKKFLGPIVTFFYKKSTVIVPSTHLDDILKDDFKTLVLENFSNCAAQPKSTVGQKCTILWNSNLIKSKGILDFLDCLINSEEFNRGEARVLILGAYVAENGFSKTQIQAAFEEKIAKVNCARVKFLGAVTKNNSDILIGNTDWVILPSRYPSECQPLAIIEAMVRGKGLVLWDTPALRATACGYPALFVNSLGELQKVINDISSGRVFPVIDGDHISEARRRFSKLKFIQVLRAHVK